MAGRAIPGEPGNARQELAWQAKVWSMSVAGFLASNLVDMSTLDHQLALLRLLSLPEVENRP